MCNLTIDELYSLINEIKLDQVRMGSQLENQEKLLKNFTDLVLTVRDIANVQTNMVEEMKYVRKDIDDIKSKPAKKLDTMQTVVITAILSGVIGFAIKAIFG